MNRNRDEIMKRATRCGTESQILNTVNEFYRNQSDDQVANCPDSIQIYPQISLGNFCSDHKLIVKKSRIKLRKPRKPQHQLRNSKLERMKLFSRELERRRQQAMSRRTTRPEQKLKNPAVKEDCQGDGLHDANVPPNSTTGIVEKSIEIISDSEKNEKVSKVSSSSNTAEDSTSTSSFIDLHTNFSQQSSVVDDYFVETSDKHVPKQRSNYFFLEERTSEDSASSTTLTNANPGNRKTSSNSSILDLDEILNLRKRNQEKISSPKLQKLIAIRTFNDDYENFDRNIEKIVSVDSSGSKRVYILRVIQNRNDLRDFKSSPSFKQSKFYVVNDLEDPVKVRKIVPIQHSEVLQDSSIADKHVKAQESFKVTKLNPSFESNGTIHLDIVDSQVENMYNVLRHE